MADITLKRIDEIEAYTGPNAIPGIRFRAAQQALGVSSWGMNVLEIDPHCSGYPEHDHASDGHEEVYLLLRGSIVLLAGGVEHTLSQGDFVRVGPQMQRKFVTRAEGCLGGARRCGRPASVGTPSATPLVFPCSTPAGVVQRCTDVETTPGHDYNE